MHSQNSVNLLRRRALLLSAISSTLPAIISCGGGDSEVSESVPQAAQPLEIPQGNFALRIGNRASVEAILHLDNTNIQSGVDLTSVEIFSPDIDIAILLNRDGIPTQIINRRDQSVSVVSYANRALETRRYNRAGEFIEGNILYALGGNTFSGRMLTEFNDELSQLTQTENVNLPTVEFLNSIISILGRRNEGRSSVTSTNLSAMQFTGLEKLQAVQVLVDSGKFTFFSDLFPMVGPSIDAGLDEGLRALADRFGPAAIVVIAAVILVFVLSAWGGWLGFGAALLVVTAAADPARGATLQTLPAPVSQLQPNGLPYGWRVTREGLTGDFNFDYTLTLISNDRTRRIGYEGVCGALGGCSLFIDDSIDLTAGVMTSGTDIWRLSESGAAIVNPETDPYVGSINTTSGVFTFAPETEVTDVTPPDSEISYTQIREFLFDARLDFNTGTIRGTVTQRLSTAWSYDGSLAVLEVIYAYEAVPR